MKKSCMFLLLGVLCAGELWAGGEPSYGMYDHAIVTYSKKIVVSCCEEEVCLDRRANILAERQHCVELLAIANNRCKILKKVPSKKENRKIEKVLQAASMADAALRGCYYCTHKKRMDHISAIDHINDDEKQSFWARYLCCCFSS